MTNQHDIPISGGYFPKNHNPHNPEAIRKWMEKLPNVRDLRVSDKAQDKLDELRLYASLKE
jgi:hypothetical protein